MLCWAIQKYHEALSWSDDTLYASHTVLKRMSRRPDKLSLWHIDPLLRLPDGGHGRLSMLHAITTI